MSELPQLPQFRSIWNKPHPSGYLIVMSSERTQQQTFLIDTNIGCLSQAQNLLESIDDRTYTEPCRLLPDQRASSQMRHVLEFYECFLNGLETGHIDYDARQRNQLLEQSREAALDTIQSIIKRLKSHAALQHDFIIWTRAEDAAHARLDDSYLTSSVARELQSLSGHSVHHFALIGVILKLNGYSVPADFGVAPSTLQYRAACAKAEAA